MKEKSKFKAWKKERKIIPLMIKNYCKAKHTEGREVSFEGGLCEGCTALAEYALHRLEKCPFKEDKHFCSFCSVHCYRADMREKVKEVMRYSGPRLLYSHPVLAFSHVTQAIKQKTKGRERRK